MAITNVINKIEAAVAIGAATEFAITTAALITVSNFAVDENAIVWRKGPSGNYEAATNKDGTIILSAIPNTAKVEGPGLFKITKDATAAEAYAGYEE